MTMPRAIQCVEKMTEKFLLHLLSCQGNYGLGSPSYSIINFHVRIGTDSLAVYLTGYFVFYLSSVFAMDTLLSVTSGSGTISYIFY